MCDVGRWPVEKQQRYLDSGWSDVLILEKVNDWDPRDETRRSKKGGGKVFGVVLLNWNQTAYRYGSFDFDALVERI